MAKGAVNKDRAVEEKACCREVRERQLRLIRDSYASFPVIRNMPCPTCTQTIRIRAYDRPAE